jgi:uncharacterized peroxidase-related enzyme
MFLDAPPTNDAVKAAFARDEQEDGYVSNHTRLWAWRADLDEAFLNLRKLLGAQTALSLRERAVLVCATASTLGDSYCALAWGTRLAEQSDPRIAAAVLRSAGTRELTEREQALERWARHVARAPNSTSPADVEVLRTAGLSEQEIFDATLFIALRIAFSTVNDALGARPDWQVADQAPAPVRAAVTYGRPVAERGE